MADSSCDAWIQLVMVLWAQDMKPCRDQDFEILDMDQSQLRVESSMTSPAICSPGNQREVPPLIPDQIRPD